MKCYDQPCESHNPYPDERRGAMDVGFETPLVLYRPPGLLTSAETGLVTHPKGDVYLVGAPFTLRWADDATGPAGAPITVPAGFITDLTSVPAAFRAFISRAGPWLEAAVVHDYLYVAWQDVPVRGHLEQDRRFADDIMLAAMGESQVPPLTKWAIYWSVRAFGGGGFHRPDKLRYANCKDPTLARLSDAVTSPF